MLPFDLFSKILAVFAVLLLALVVYQAYEINSLKLTIAEERLKTQSVIHGIELQNQAIESMRVEQQKREAEYNASRVKIVTKWHTIYQEVNASGGDECDKLRALLHRF